MHTDALIVGFDLDGVVIDHTQNKITIAARYGVHLRPEDTPTETLEHILSPEIHQALREQLYDDTDEALSAPLMEGAFNGLASLREHHIPYFLISRRKKPIHALHLIERRGLWGDYFTPENTFFVEAMKDKDIVAKRLGVTHYIDDETRVLELMPSVPHRFVFDSRSSSAQKGVYPCLHNWGEVGQVLGIANL